MAMDRDDIVRLLQLLNDELAGRDISGEIYLVGGAVMCIVHQSRQSTQDLDAFFRPAGEIRVAAEKIAAREDCSPDWLNDAVKGFLSESGDFDPFLQLSNLSVFTASPEYLLAMKCLSMRLGAEFHDEADVRYLLRFLNIERYEAALEIISRYYPLDRIPQKTLYALEEQLGSR